MGEEGKNSIALFGNTGVVKRRKEYRRGRSLADGSHARRAAQKGVARDSCGVGAQLRVANCAKAAESEDEDGNVPSLRPEDLCHRRSSPVAVEA